MSQSTHTTVLSQESLATASASIPASVPASVPASIPASVPNPNPIPNPNRSADIEAALEHLNSMGYAPPASLVERTPASGFYGSVDAQGLDDHAATNANAAVTSSSQSFETQQADAPPDYSPDENNKDQSSTVLTAHPKEHDKDDNIAGALLHMSTVYHYAPPDSILHSSTPSHSNNHKRT
jgi:hypothetical protein